MTDNLSEKLRRQLYAKKFTGYLILFAIGLVFVFFGYSGKTKLSGVGSVARVNDALISVADYQGEESRVSQYYANIFGGGVDLGAQRNFLRQQALENLVRSELVVQAAQKEGVFATDAEVRDFIVKGIPAFQDGGQFQRDRYKAYLESSHLNAADFENRVRKDITNLRTHHMLELATRPMSLELAKVKELQQNKIDIGFVRLDSEAVSKGLKISEAEVAKALQDPQFLKQVQDRFQSNKAEWSKAETVKAQHILIAAKQGDAGSDGKALALAQSLKARLSKEDFGKLAAQYSEDPGSKSKKGMLDPFTRGKMVKEFEDAAFAAKVGQVSEPVKTPFGYHLIKVLEHTQASEPTFEQVKNQVAAQIMARAKAEALLKSLDETVAKGDEKQVQGLLRELNVSWEETGYFDLGGDSIPKLPAGPVADAAFEVSAQKPFLNHVIHENGARFLVKFIGAKVEAAKDDETTLAETLERRRAEGSYGQWLNQFREASRIEINPDAFQK